MFLKMVAIYHFGFVVGVLWLSLEYLVVFIAVQNLSGIDALTVSITCKF